MWQTCTCSTHMKPPYDISNLYWKLVDRNPYSVVCEQQSRKLDFALISAFVISFLEWTFANHDTCKLSMFYLVSVAEQADRNLTRDEITKTSFFLATRPIRYKHTNWQYCNTGLSYCPASQDGQWRHVLFTKLSGTKNR